MQRFEIFRTGRHTAASGATLSFSEDDVRRAVEAYDPAVHEAPIVVGHPKDNAPAYGWVKALAFGEGGAIEADPIQVDPAFAEMVAAGRFKKRSASFYTPDSPNNPKPGVYYLRHVGFLGAQPPAVKGLKEVAFAEDDGVVEFTDSSFVASLVARFARSMRDWLISEKGIEAANTAVPDYLVSSLEDEARKPVDAVASPLFTESNAMQITPEQLAAGTARANKAEADLKAANDAAAAREASFAEREAKIAEREKAAARVQVEAAVDKAIADGKVLPAERKTLVEFAMLQAGGEATFDFGEGDAAKKLSPRDAFLASLDARPKVVAYGEHAGADKGGSGAEGMTAHELAAKAVEFQEAQATKGKKITVTEAVAAVRAGKTD